MMPHEMLDAPLTQDPDAWGEIAFQRFCTPAASRYRSADHHVLVERARFHLANASAVRVRMAEGRLVTQKSAAGLHDGMNMTCQLRAMGWSACYAQCLTRPPGAKAAFKEVRPTCHRNPLGF